MVESRSCTPWPPSEVLVVVTPTWSARRLMSLFPRELVSSLSKSLRELLLSSRTLLSTRFPLGSSTDSVTSPRARTPTCLSTSLTTSSVRTLSALRRSVPTEVLDITGVSRSEVSTPRPPLEEDVKLGGVNEIGLILLSLFFFSFWRIAIVNRREHVGTYMPSLPDIVDLTGLCIGRHCHVFHIVYFCVLISKNFLSEKSEPNVSFKFTQRVLDIDYNFYLFVFFILFFYFFFLPPANYRSIHLQICSDTTIRPLRPHHVC